MTFANWNVELTRELATATGSKKLELQAKKESIKGMRTRDRETVTEDSSDQEKLEIETRNAWRDKLNAFVGWTVDG
jgi:hypothetical protein